MCMVADHCNDCVNGPDCPGLPQLLITSGTPEAQMEVMGILEGLKITPDHDGLSPQGYEVSALVRLDDLLPLPPHVEVFEFNGEELIKIYPKEG